MISAHWTTAIPLIGGSAEPETIHDFDGFPEELYRLQYRAVGSPELARRVQYLLLATGLQAQIDDSRGLDHGAWVPLMHMYPKADVPVIQVSVQPHLDAAHHVALGGCLGAAAE